MWFVFILQRVDDILQFIENFTVYVEGVGDVCRLACNAMISSFDCLLGTSYINLSRASKQYYLSLIL